MTSNRSDPKDSSSLHDLSLHDPRLHDAASFAALARSRLTLPRARSGDPSDFDLNPELAGSKPQQLREAAVLVPVVGRRPLTMLLTQRTDTLTKHAGQIAFPGGRLDPQESATAAALREAAEEIGLASELVRPLGFLDTYVTGTGYAIAPLLALVEPGFTLRLEPAEVADAFEVPLAFLMNEANHQTHTREWQGAARRFYAMPYENRYIWGATAGILKNMHERLFA
jgi:8-oxo-dGTP pyrophosphatase MutT (NUDIX family)